MKKLSLLLLPAACMAFLLHSCSIEKRHYRSGYHIEWKHKVKTAGAETTTEDETASLEKTIKSSKNNEAAPVVTEVEPANILAPVQNTVVTPVAAPREESKKTSGTAYKSNGVGAGFTSVEAENISKNKITTLAETKNKSSQKKPMEADYTVLIILCFFIPWLAVGLVTDWGMPVVWNLLWSLTCIGAIIHAIIVVNREY